MKQRFKQAFAAILCTLIIPAAAAQLPVSEQLSRTGLRVHLTPVQHTVLSSEIAGRIDTLSLRAGDSFRAGEELVQLNCALHEARLDKAVAQADEAARIKAVNIELDRYRSISTLEVDVAAARLAAAQAEINLMQVVVEKCRILAPFDGKVVSRHVQPHQYVGEGQELLAIVDDSQLEVELVVPSRLLTTLGEGRAFDIAIDETGKVYRAQIDRIGVTIDAVSQTIKVFAMIMDPAPELRVGMSGTANLGRP